MVCSSGCFQRPSFVRQLFQAQSRGIRAVLIIVDGNFQFPSEPFYEQLRALSAHIMHGTDRHVDDLIALIGSLFEEIGISLRGQDSQAVHEVRAAAVVNRLGTPRRPLLPDVVPSLSSSSDTDPEEIQVEVLDDELSVRVRL